MNFGEVRRAQLAKSTFVNSTLVPPGNFSDILRSVQMLKRKRGPKSNVKLPHLFIPSKTVTLVSKFAVEDVLWAELQPLRLSLQ